MATNQTLQKGARGEAVKQLQRDLNRATKAGLEVDGDFGPDTDKKVRAFQKQFGLEVDGVVGPQTRTKLNAVLAALDAKPNKPVTPVKPPVAGGTTTPKPNKKTSAGAKAVAYMRGHRVYEHGGNNRGTVLDRLWIKYREGRGDFVGSPWCGLAVWDAFLNGAGIDLRKATAIVYTPSVTASARAGQKFSWGGKRYKLIAVRPSQVRKGDIVLFDWAGPSGSSPLDDSASETDHIGLATGPVTSWGTVPTIEGNTQPGSSGDQSGHGGGDGTYERERPLSSVICFARVVDA